MTVKPRTIQAMLADMRGYVINPVRAAQIAREAERVNAAAREEGARNEFNAQPTDFSVTLARLARK